MREVPAGHLPDQLRAILGQLFAAPGDVLVRTDQVLGTLAVYLLEPESDDGLATWNLLDTALRRGAEFPVARLASIPRGPRRLVP